MIKKVKNMQAFDKVGVSLDEYIEWCRLNNIPYNKSDSKRRFFNELRKGSISVENTKIIKKGE